MRSFFLFVLFIAAAVFITRQPPQVFYESSNTPRSSKVNRSLYRTGDDNIIVWRGEVTGPPRETHEAADNDAMAKAGEQIQQALSLDRAPSVNDIEQLIKEQKEADVDLGPTLKPAKAVTLTLAMTSAQAKEISRHERAARVGDRLYGLSQVTAAAVAGLFLVAGSIRVADWSKSRRTRI